MTSFITIGAEPENFFQKIWKIPNFTNYPTNWIPSPLFKTGSMQWSLKLRKIKVEKGYHPFELDGEFSSAGEKNIFSVELCVHVMSAKEEAILVCQKEFKAHRYLGLHDALKPPKPLSHYLVRGELTLLLEVAFSEDVQHPTTSSVVDDRCRSVSSERISGLDTMPADLESYSKRSVGDLVLYTDADDEEFVVHKFMLSARFPVFEQVISKVMLDNRTNTVRIRDLGTPVLRQIVNYMYGKEVQVTSYDLCMGLYAAANKYDMHDLKQQCGRVLARHLDVATVCDVASMAHRHHDHGLLASTKRFMASRAEVFLTKGWDDLKLCIPDLAREITDEVGRK